MSILPTTHDMLSMRLPDVIKEAMCQRNELVEPTVSERRSVFQYIIGFIKRKRRIVYGGQALNVALGTVGATDAIYEGEGEDHDIEFYSWQSMQDITDLCDELQDAGYTHVEAKLAIHDDTYSIHVNFQKYCDVTYMPRILFRNVPIIEKDGVMYVHPHFSLIDYLRVMCDPLTSYFRLEKDMHRLMLLQKHFPLKRPNVRPTRDTIVDEVAKDVEDILNNVFKDRASCVLVGSVATRFYSFTPLAPIDLIEVISTSFPQDAAVVHEFLVTKFKGVYEVEYVEHHRFYDFWGHRGIFSVGGVPLVVMYDNNHRGIPYTDSWNGFRYGTFSVTLMMLLVRHQWLNCNGFVDRADACMHQAIDLLEQREAYLQGSDVTVFDNSPFQEFVTRTVGQCMSPIRVKALRIQQRDRRKRPIVFKYKPVKEKPDYITNFTFDNTSGNTINSERDRLFNPVCDNTLKQNAPDEVV